MTTMTDDQVNAAVTRLAREFGSLVSNDGDAVLVMTGLMAHFSVCFDIDLVKLCDVAGLILSAPENSSVGLSARRRTLQ